MSKTNRMTKSAIMIILLMQGSKIFGFFRETLIATKFGSGVQTDVFFVSIGAISLISDLINQSIATTFIPVLSEVEVNEGKSAKIRHTNNMINIMLGISVFLILITWFASPLIIRLTAKSFPVGQLEESIRLFRIGLPMILFSGVIGSLTGYLHSEEKFISSAAIGFPFNFVYIVYLVFLSSNFGIEGLMVAAIVATISQFIIQIPDAIIAGFRYGFIFNPNDKYVKKVLFLSVPVLIGVAINDLNLIIDRTLASGLISGSISSLSYANKISTLILSGFLAAITTVLFPALSRESNIGNIPTVKKIMARGVNLILIITVPTTVGLIILAVPTVQIVFGRGAFKLNDVMMTSSALTFYILGLTASSLWMLVTRVFYSLQDTKSPVIIATLGLGLNVFFNLILIKYMAHAGLALATSISNTVSIIILFYFLRQKIGPLGASGFVKCGMKIGLASSVMGAVVYFVYHSMSGFLDTSFFHKLISLAITVILGIIVYTLLCFVLKVNEVRNIIFRIGVTASVK